MDQMKIGSFLQEMRKEKNITQEQLADQLNVSRRTVSRWETGINLPDLDILIELSEYYQIDLRELLDGERKVNKMDKELTETVLKVADYSNEEKQKFTGRLHVLFLVGILTAAVYSVMYFFMPAETTGIYGFVQGFCLGTMIGTIIVGAIMTSRYASRIHAYKQRIFRRAKKIVIGG